MKKSQIAEKGALSSENAFSKPGTFLKERECLLTESNVFQKKSHCAEKTYVVSTSIEKTLDRPTYSKITENFTVKASKTDSLTEKLNQKSNRISTFFGFNFFS